MTSHKTLASVDTHLFSLQALIGAEKKVKASALAGGSAAAAITVILGFMTKLSFVKDMSTETKTAVATLIVGLLVWIGSFVAGFAAPHTERSSAAEVAPADTTAPVAADSSPVTAPDGVQEPSAPATRPADQMVVTAEQLAEQTAAESGDKAPGS